MRKCWQGNRKSSSTSKLLSGICVISAHGIRHNNLNLETEDLCKEVSQEFIRTGHANICLGCLRYALHLASKEEDELGNPIGCLSVQHIFDFHINRYFPGKLLLFERISIMNHKGRGYPLSDRYVWRAAWLIGRDSGRPPVLYFWPSLNCSTNLDKLFSMLFFFWVPHKQKHSSNLSQMCGCYCKNNSLFLYRH